MLRRLSGGLSGTLATSRGSGAGDEELSCSTMAETVHGTAALPHPAENDQTIRGGWLYKQVGPLREKLVRQEMPPCFFTRYVMDSSARCTSERLGMLISHYSDVL